MPAGGKRRPSAARWALGTHRRREGGARTWAKRERLLRCTCNVFLLKSFKARRICDPTRCALVVPCRRWLRCRAWAVAQGSRSDTGSTSRVAPHWRELPSFQITGPASSRPARARVLLFAPLRCGSGGVAPHETGMAGVSNAPMSQQAQRNQDGSSRKIYHRIALCERLPLPGNLHFCPATVGMGVSRRMARCQVSGVASKQAPTRFFCQKKRKTPREPGALVCCAVEVSAGLICPLGPSWVAPGSMVFDCVTHKKVAQ